MRQRIGIAQALLGAPPVLVVDEPTTGLDVESRIRFREILLAAAADRIIILSTHIAGDVEATASRILLVHRSRLRFDGPPAALIHRARGRIFEMVLPDSEIREFGRKYRITSRVRVLDGIRVRAVRALHDHLSGTSVEPTLEEAFLASIDLFDAARPELTRSGRFSFLAPRRSPRAHGSSDRTA